MIHSEDEPRLIFGRQGYQFQVESDDGEITYGESPLGTDAQDPNTYHVTAEGHTPDAFLYAAWLVVTRSVVGKMVAATVHVKPSDPSLVVTIRREDIAREPLGSQDEAMMWKYFDIGSVALEDDTRLDPRSHVVQMAVRTAYQAAGESPIHEN